MNTQKTWLKEALQQDGGYQVFQYYGFTPQNKVQLYNPFREEKTCSFFIRKGSQGNYYFKDFGDDFLKGNAFQFVMWMENCTPAGVWEKLAQIYNTSLIIPQNTRKSKNFRTPIIANKTQNISAQKKELLNIQFRDFNKDELEFWQKKGNIDLKTLKTEKVKAIQEFTIGFWQEGKITTKTYYQQKFVFAFEIVPQKSYKLYQPIENYRQYGKSKTIFLPHLEVAKEKWGENFTYSFGLENIKPNENAILCGGEADCLALKKLGYNAFTLGAEVANLSDFIQEKLKEKNIFDKISVLYDTDFTGVEHSQLLQKKYGFNVLTLPKLAQQKTKKEPKPIFNDVCDYLQQYGFDADFRLSLAQKTQKVWDFKLKNVPHLSVNQYLSECKTEIIHFLQAHTHTQIEAGAGVGKTYTLLNEILSELADDFLFCVPFSVQVEQIEREYNSPNIVCFHNKNQEEEHLHWGKINVCTYDKASILFEKRKDLKVVIDESHLMIAAMPYRKLALLGLENIIQKASQVILLSATPDYMWLKENNFKNIKIERKYNPLIHCQIKEYENQLEQNIIHLAKNHLEENKTGLMVVRLNHKSMAKRIMALMEKYADKNEIDMAFAEKIKGEASQTYQNVVNNGKIDDTIRLLFTSSCFDCGVNIYNENLKSIVIAENLVADNHAEILVQVAQRFRKMKKIKVVLLKKKKIEQDTKSPSPFGEGLGVRSKKEKPKISILEHYSQKYESLLNIATAQKQDIIFEENLWRAWIKKPNYWQLDSILGEKYRFLHWQNDDFNTSLLKVLSELRTFVYQNLDLATYQNMAKNWLPNLHFEKYQEEMNNNFVDEQVFNETIKTLKKEQKEIKNKEYQKACESLANDSNDFMQRVAQSNRDIQLQQKIKSNFVINISQNTEKSNKIENELAKKYFILQAFCLSDKNIFDLLKNNTTNENFYKLKSTLKNQIKLKAYENFGNDCQYLLPEKKEREELDFLVKLKDFVNNQCTKNIYAQTKTKEYAEKIKVLETKINFLEEELKKLNEKLKEKSTQFKQKTIFSRLEKKQISLVKKQSKLKMLLAQTQEKWEHSQVKGWKLEDLTQSLQAFGKLYNYQLTPKQWLHLLRTLFVVESQTIKIMDKNEYKDIVIFNLQKEWNLSSFLTEKGLSKNAVEQYEKDLLEKIQTDILKNKTIIFSKTTQKAIEQNIYNINKVENCFVEENEKGYPKGWD